MIRKSEKALFKQGQNLVRYTFILKDPIGTYTLTKDRATGKDYYQDLFKKYLAEGTLVSSVCYILEMVRLNEYRPVFKWTFCKDGVFPAVEKLVADWRDKLKASKAERYLEYKKTSNGFWYGHSVDDYDLFQ